MPSTTLDHKLSSTSLHRPYSAKRHNKHLRDLNGTWRMSKTLTTGVPAALALQGQSASARRAFIASPLELWISQMNYPSQIMVKQSPAASSLPQQTEKLFPPQRIGRWSEWSEQRSQALGSTRSRCRWVRPIRAAAAQQQQQQQQVVVQDDCESTSTGTSNDTTATAMESSVEDFLLGDVGEGEFLDVEIEGMSWCARQVWVVDAYARLVRRVVTWGEGGKRAETRLVYDFLPA